MISTRNETVMKGRKCEIYSIRKVLEATDREVGVKGKGVNENFGLKSIGRVLKPNNGGVGFVLKKNASGSGMGALLDCVGDSFNKRKPPDGKSGYNRQLILDLLSAVEGIVGNLHQTLE
ncbi:hypothetical protein Gorai_018695 [Gossypium raimondii]|uniref:Uncharacterized protein n=1 Tax=Gossypium raimondii TaxID=29730 RepID=A0A7J8PL52_GOSRA|nr:hypothetical protein [Gossypium raimondii]